MFRLALSMTFLASLSASAMASTLRVDTGEIPIPAELEDQWQRVQDRDVWRTEGGREINGRFARFVVRRYELLVIDGELHVRATWFRDGSCHTKTAAVSDLDEGKQAFLRDVFGDGDRSTSSITVVYCDFNGRRGGRGDGEEEGDGGEGADRRGGEGEGTDGSAATSQAIVAEGDDSAGEGDRGEGDRGEGDRGEGDRGEGDRGEGEDDDETEERDRRPPPRLIPFRRLNEGGKALLGPFAALARRSFEGRLQGATCTEVERREREDETDDEETEDEGNGRRRFGFEVKRFASAPGSLEFRLEETRDVCIRADNPADAYRRLRERFAPHINPANQDRISYRFRPKPPACAERREGDNDEGGDLEPMPDPVGADGSGSDSDSSAFPGQ